MNIDISGGNSLYELDRRKKLAQQLQANSQKPVQNNFQALTQILSGALGAYSEGKVADEEKAALAKALSSSGLTPDQQATIGQFGPDATKAVLAAALTKQMTPTKRSTAVLPDGSIALVDKDAGSYSLAKMEGQQAMQPAAPTMPIQSRDLPPVGQPGTGGEQLPQLADLIRDPQGNPVPPPPPIAPPNMQGMPAEPTTVPLPEALPPTGAFPKVTQLPRPTPTGNMVADQKALQDWQAANLELQKKAAVPPTAKERMAETSKKRAQTGFDSIMEDMNQVYDDLASVDAAPSESKSWDENLGIWVTKTNPVAQYIGEKAGTKAQSIIQRLDPLKTRAKEQIMMATGMSSKAIDSNAEMKSFLDSLTNVNNTREANAFTIQTMQRLYGTPEKAAARDAAIKSGQIKPITDFSGQGGSNANTSGSSGGGAPAVGTVEDGYEFLGGDPSKPESWRAK